MSQRLHTQKNGGNVVKHGELQHRPVSPAGLKWCLSSEGERTKPLIPSEKKYETEIILHKVMSQSEMLVPMVSLIYIGFIYHIQVCLFVSAFIVYEHIICEFQHLVHPSTFCGCSFQYPFVLLKKKSPKSLEKLSSVSKSLFC